MDILRPDTRRRAAQEVTLPQARVTPHAIVIQTTYATAGYEQSAKNLARTSLDRDNVFGDGHDWQVATVTGDATSGYIVALTVGVEA